MIREVQIHFDALLPSLNRMIAQLFGVGACVDTDGDSKSADDQEWTDMTIQRRDGARERVDVVRIAESPRTFRIRASTEELAERASAVLCAPDEASRA